MRFAQLWPLWLLAALPLIWLLAWQHHRRASRARLIWASALRTLTLILITLALMQPSLRQTVRSLSVVYAVDVSQSIARRGIDETLRWIDQIDQRFRPDRSRLLVFANRPQLAMSTAQARAIAHRVDSTNADRLSIDPHATNLEEALAAAIQGFAPASEKHLVLVTDGNATRGDVMRALPPLQRLGVRVFTVPAPLAVQNDAWVEALRLESPRRDQTIEMQAEVFSLTRSAAQLSLFVNDRLARTVERVLEPGRNGIPLEVRFDREGDNRLALEVHAAGDEIASNNRLERSVWVGPPPRVLYVESSMQSSHYFADALRRQGIAVKTIGPEAMRPQSLRDVDVVVLSDVPPQQIPPAVADAIEAFVRDRGGGLIFAAGEHTYGKDGYAGSAIERVLPITFEGKRNRRDFDLVLLIDRSYSMRGRKLELAKSAALATLDLLEEEHRLAVIGFDAQPREVVALAAVGNKRRAEDLIAGMTSSGQTSLYPALLRAQQLLADSTAPTRHIILLSDGITASPMQRSASTSEQVQAMVRDARADVIRREGGVVDTTPALPATVGMDAFAELATQLKDAKITLSTIAVGDKPNRELLEGLAKWANGKYYAAKEDSEIPGLFVTEAKRLLGASIIEEPFRPIAKAPSVITGGLAFGRAPELKGFVVSRAKPFSEVLLEARKDKPLLVKTQYGLGTTIAFLSDVKNRWAADWLQWPGYGQLWAQAIRAALPRDVSLIQWDVRREAGEAFVDLSALDEQMRDRADLSPRVRVTRPDGRSDTLALRQVAPGHYSARMPLTLSRERPTAFELLAQGGLSAAQLAQVGPRSLFYAFGDEDKVLPVDVPLLRSIAAQTNASYAPPNEEIFVLRDPPNTREVEIWRYLVVTALLAYLLDILVRRASLPSRRAKADVV
ncbi:MAG TPA: VWA domain-containing protein [Burkholderiales bacterium]|nr:VWA domain-containing protein [Burkholderiales bacterium]